MHAFCPGLYHLQAPELGNHVRPGFSVRCCRLCKSEAKYSSPAACHEAIRAEKSSSEASFLLPKDHGFFPSVKMEKQCAIASECQQESKATAWSQKENQRTSLGLSDRRCRLPVRKNFCSRFALKQHSSKKPQGLYGKTAGSRRAWM